MTAEIRLPASTSNLGPGFDCFGLALKLYLTVRATPVPGSEALCRVKTTGADDNEALPRNEDNLIYRAMTAMALPYALGVALLLGAGSVLRRAVLELRGADNSEQAQPSS